METAGYKQSQNDHSLFVKHEPYCITILLVYVDDIIITRNSSVAIDALKTFMHFQLRDLGSLKYFLDV